MKMRACALVCAAMLQTSSLGAQTFGRDGQLLVRPDDRNVAAAQVAVAQTRLYGSMLVSYRAITAETARITIATRSEVQIVEVDSEKFQARLVRRIKTSNGLPRGALVCRSYAPVDSILATAKARFPRSSLEVLPPHRAGQPWQARIANRLMRVSFDKNGKVIFKHQSGR